MLGFFGAGAAVGWNSLHLEGHSVPHVFGPVKSTIVIVTLPLLLLPLLTLNLLVVLLSIDAQPLARLVTIFNAFAGLEEGIDGWLSSIL